MHGIRLDSDVEDTPDKQSLRQLNRARERTAQVNRSPIAGDVHGKAAVSGKQLVAAQAVRRSRLRLASKGSASSPVKAAGIPLQGDPSTSQPPTVPHDAPAVPRLPSAQPELAITPQRPQPRPRRQPADPNAGAAASAAVQGKPPLRRPAMFGQQQQAGATETMAATAVETAAAGAATTAFAAQEGAPQPGSGSRDANDAMPALQAEVVQGASAQAMGQEAAESRGAAPAATTTTAAAAGTTEACGAGANVTGAKKTVQSKLNFFAPQVRRASKEGKPANATPALIAPEPSMAATAAGTAFSGPAEPPQQPGPPQEPQHEPQQLSPDDVTRLQQAHMPALQFCPAPIPPVRGALTGPIQDPSSDGTHIDLTAAEEEAAPVTVGAIAAPPGAPATAAPSGAELKQQQQDCGLATQRVEWEAAPAPSRRPRRQALLPGAPPPPPLAPHVASAGVASAGAAAAGGLAPPAPAGVDPEVPQAGGGRQSPVKRRHRSSGAGEAEGPAAAATRGRGRGSGRGRAGRGGGAAAADALAPDAGEAAAAALSDGADSIVDDSDDEAEAEPTGRGRGRGSFLVRASGRGRGRGGRGRGRTRGEGESRGGRGGRGRRGSAAAATSPISAAVSAGQAGGSGSSTAAGAPLLGKQEEQALQAAAQSQPFGEYKPGTSTALGAPVFAAAPEGVMAADKTKENRPLPQDPLVDLNGGAPAAGGVNGGDAGPGRAAKAAGPVAHPTGPVNEMFLSVAERRRRQKQRQEEEAAAQRRAAEEKEQREREQRERDQREADERQRGRERKRERQRAEAAAATESIDLSGSPKAPAPVPVNPFFRARKRQEPPAGGETGGAAKRPSSGIPNAVGGGANGSGARLLPALAPVHVWQPSDGAAAAGEEEAVNIVATDSCLLQLDTGGALRLVPADVPLPPRWLPSFSTPAAAVDVGRNLAALRFSFLRPAQAGPVSQFKQHLVAATRQDGASTQPGASSVSASAAGSTPGAGGVGAQAVEGGRGGIAVAPLLEELATYLAEAQSREACCGALDGEAEAELLDFPTREEILRQLTDELNLRRRRVAVQQPQLPLPPPQQQQAGTHAAGGDASGGGGDASGGGAGTAAAGAGAADQLWCAAQQPVCAAELCGNAAQVGRLRDWLCQWREIIRREGQRREEGAAAAASAKRPRRGRRFSNDSDFTDNDDSDWDARSAGGTADSDGEGGDGRAEHKGLPTAMLLRGPVGCGKTAAAYAVASELGFRVLEVNPSADRSGPQLLRMVGEATKSRRLVQGLTAAGGAGGALFGAKIAAPAAAPVAGPTRGGRRGREAVRDRRCGGRKASRRTMSALDDSASGASSPSPSPVKRRRGGGRGSAGRGGSAAARLFGAKDTAADAAAASDATDGGDAAAAAAGANGPGAGSVTMMLFDEVDVLPDEDKGFVGALVSIIQQSKRPIILTAGRGQLPPSLRALGLQELEFQPAPETRILRTVAMTCAAAAAAGPEQALRRPQQQAAGTAAASGLGSAGPRDACMAEPEVLDLSAIDDAGYEGAGVAEADSGPSQRLLLPSLLRLVRSCRGDLRHTLHEAQFWLGPAGGSGRGFDGGGGSSETCDGSAEDEGPLSTAWRAVEDALAAAATAAIAADASAVAVNQQNVLSVDSFGALMPTAGLWLPMPSAGAPAAEPPQQQQLAALSPAVRHLQWQSYEEERRRVREQQLASRWLELEVARAAARIANRRPRGSAGRITAEGETPEPADEEDEEDGGSSGGDNDAAAAADAGPEEAPERVSPHPEGEAVESTEQGEQQQQGMAGTGLPSGVDAGDVEASATAAAPLGAVATSVPEAQVQQQQLLPQKRRASEEAGADAAAFAAGPGSDAAGTAGGAKRSRLSRSRPTSMAGTAAACSPAAASGAHAVDHERMDAPGAEQQAAVAADEGAPVCGGDAVEGAPNTGDGPASVEASAKAPGPILAPLPPAWAMPSAPSPMPYNPEALAALAAAAMLPGPPPDAAVDAPSGPFHASVCACRAQAALADLYGMLSELDVLGTPRDNYMPVSGPCPMRHQAAYAAVRPVTLGVNLALQPPPLDLYSRPGTAWVLADAVRDQEDVPGRLLSVLASETEAAGLGAGEPVGTMSRSCAAEAATTVARLASAAAVQLRGLRLLTPPAAAATEPQQALLAHGSSPWQLAELHGALQATAPGWCCASGRGAAMDRLGALASICRAEAVRQQREARRAKWVRRAPVFCHYLASLEPPRLAALHQLTLFGPQAESGGAEGAQEEVEGLTAGDGAGGRPRWRGGW